MAGPSGVRDARQAAAALDPARRVEPAPLKGTEGQREVEWAGWSQAPRPHLGSLAQT